MFQTIQTIIEWVIQNPVSSVLVIIAICLLSLAIALIRRHPDDARLWFTGLRYRAPVIGKIASLGRSTDITDDGWFRSEITLCDAFYARLQAYSSDKEYYEKAISYLQKVQEYGRRPMSFWHWFAIIIFLAIEAVLFGFVVLDIAVPGLSYNMSWDGAILVGIFIAVVAVGVTHWTGREMHRGDLIKKARIWWANKSGGKPASPIIGVGKQVGISNDESDDHEPQYIQLLNRIEHNKDATPADRWWIVGTVVLTLMLAGSMGGIRYFSQQAELDKEQQIIAELNEVQAAPDEEDNDSIEDRIRGSARAAGILTYTMIAVVFVILQCFSVALGRTSALVGHDSRRAYRLTRRFDTGKHLESWQRDKESKISSVANEMLTRLQEKIRQRVSVGGTNDEALEVMAKKRDFDDYLKRRKLRETLAEGVDK